MADSGPVARPDATLFRSPTDLDVDCTPPPSRGTNYVCVESAACYWTTGAPPKAGGTHEKNDFVILLCHMLIVACISPDSDTCLQLVLEQVVQRVWYAIESGAFLAWALDRDGLGSFSSYIHKVQQGGQQQQQQ